MMGSGPPGRRRVDVANGAIRARDWVIRAGESRRSRFHDYQNRRLAVEALADMPTVVWQAALRRLVGRRPILPWIPYPAIRRLAKIIRPEWRVLETGSGNSTLWLAQRVAYLRSVESNSGWYARVGASLPP